MAEITEDKIAQMYIACLKKFEAALESNVTSYPTDALFNKAMNKIQEALQQKQSIIYLPNVCCSQTSCPHNIFYDCVVQILKDFFPWKKN